MKTITAMTVLMMAGGTAAVAAQNSAAAENRVVVYVKYGGVAVNGSKMAAARTQASQLFAAAGIRLEWKSSEPKSEEASVRVVGIQFVPTAPERFRDRSHSQALAVAEPYSTGHDTIVVFADRVDTVTDLYKQQDAGKVLGHVLAHELGHMVEGIARHSVSGLMKPHWTLDDYSVMTRHGLQFAQEDLELLRATFVAQAATVAAETR